MLKKNSKKIDRNNVEDILGLTPTQEGMLFHYLSHEKDYYIEQLSLEISGQICLKSLKKAWDYVIKTNEVLRAVFRWDKLEKPIQIILKKHQVPIVSYDLCKCSTQKKQQIIEDIKKQDKETKIDLEISPLRISILKTSNIKCEIVITWHHILFDGWSTGIILKEFFNAYNSFYDNKDIGITNKTKYKNYIKWYKGQNKNIQKEFWKGYLNEIQDRTSLPYSSNKIKKEKGIANYILKFNAKESNSIYDYSKNNEITLASLLYSTWGILLQKYNNSNDVLFGTTLSGRNAPVKGIDDIVGLFINTIPLRVISEKDQRASSLIKKVDKELKERSEYENTSLLDIISYSGIKGNENIFDSIVVLENYPLDSSVGNNKSVKIENYSMLETTNYDITLGINCFDNIELDFSYNSDKFIIEVIEKMALHFKHVLLQIVNNKKISISEIDIITETEKRQILYQFNKPIIVEDKIELVHKLFEKQVDRNPDKIAVIFGDKKLTYKEINQKSNLLARILIKKGVKPDDLIAVLVDRSENIIISLLGVLKAGCAYVPIDNEYSKSRISYILEDTKAKILITEKNLWLEDNFSNDIVYINDFDIYDKEVLNINTKCSPENLAYIIYTSGSTGNPKGVMVEHRNLINYVKAFQNEFSINSEDTVLQQASFAFDQFVEEIYPALLTGATVVLTKRMDILDINRLREIIIKNDVTFITCQPLLLNELNKYPNLEKVHTYLSGGDVVKSEHISDLLKRAKVYNTYGPTETSVCATYYRCTCFNHVKNIPIGKPILNYNIYILDSHNNLMPIGVPGEICISGAGVARGYLNRDKLTKSKFIVNPFDSSMFMYRTGDMGKWLLDGNIEFLGRYDDQVKIRGFRIEPDEIEYNLIKHHAVKEAVVLPIETVNGMKSLAAYIKLEGETNSLELKEFLGENLPSYMIPSYFYRIDNIPMTSNAKVDKKALLNCSMQLSSGNKHKKDLSDNEKRILKIWTEILNEENIDCDENFFDVGGNSILLMQMHAKLEKEFSCDINVAELFSHTTINKIASLMNDEVAAVVDDDKSVEKSDKKTWDTSNNDIAIIGVSLKLPLADTIDEFYDNLKNGIDCVRQIPEQRKKDTNSYFEYIGKDLSQLTYGEAAFLDSIDKFDYAFFNISPKEAKLLDPNQRLFLQSVWSAIEDSGYACENLKGSKTGIFLGYGSDSDYKNMIARVEPESYSLSMPGNVKAIIASRISYILDFKGPSMVVDTTCSSSLVAIHLACQSIINEECETAVAGGIQLHLMPIREFEVGIESSTNRTKAFDDNSDGTGAGEGVISIVLKPFDKALKDNDNIYAVIKSTAINHDGNTNGLTAPNPQAQADVLKNAWNKADINPELITYIETHGTGTKLGDPIEIEGIKRAFNSYTNKKQFCAVGSVKSNIGHLDNTAGVAGLLKAVLSLKYAQLFPTLHFKRPNRKICFEDSPVYVNDALRDWESVDGRRICGVSSFGMSGTNCHVILDEAPKIETNNLKDFTQDSINQIFTISAKTKTALIAYINKYCSYLKNNMNVDFQRLCYTANTGRDKYKCRVAVIAKNTRELYKLLNNINNNSIDTYKDNYVYTNFNIKEILDKNKEYSEINEVINKYHTSKPKDLSILHKLCRLYASGLDIDWNKLYTEKIKKISIPTYPFEDKRCWLDIPEISTKDDANYKDNFFYTPIWEMESLEYNDVLNIKGDVVLFKDDEEVANLISTNLKNKAINVIEISLGNSFYKTSKNEYVISSHFDDYLKLTEDINWSNVSNVIHAFSLSEHQKTKSLNELQENLQKSVYSLFNFIKAIANNNIQSQLEIILLSSNASRILIEQNTVNTYSSAMFSLGKVIGWEYKNIKLRSIDIDNNTDIKTIINEINSSSKDYKVAFRYGKRYVEKIDKVNFDKHKKTLLQFKDDGVYIITGGLGGIGIKIAKGISKKHNINIAFINRTPLPRRDEWDSLLRSSNNNSIIKKIKAIKEIEKTGSKVVCISADITNENELNKALIKLRKNFGKVNGIIHAAGVSAGDIIGSLPESEFKRVLAPKVDGTWLLDKLTMNDDLDFFIMFSSAITMVGGLGGSAYTSANAFLDSFSQKARNKNIRTLVINWPTWENTGLSEGEEVNDDNEIFKTITPEDAVNAFMEILYYDIGQVFIGELNTYSSIFKLGDFLPFRLSDKVNKLLLNDNLNAKNAGQINQKKQLKAVKLKGSINKEYLYIENIIASAWREVLGYEELDVNDNFFEIGGDSILITKVHTVLKESFKDLLSVADLFSFPTIAKLAQHINSIDKTENEIFTELDFKNEVFTLFNSIEKGELDIKEAVDIFQGLEV